MCKGRAEALTAICPCLAPFIGNVAALSYNTIKLILIFPNTFVKNTVFMVNRSTGPAHTLDRKADAWVGVWRRICEHSAKDSVSPAG